MEKRIHCQFVEEVIDFKKVSIDKKHGSEYVFYYKIKWKPTWEIESSLQEHCNELINKYWSTRDRPKSPMEQETRFKENVIESIDQEIIFGNCTEDVMVSDQDLVIKEEIDIDIMAPIDSIMDTMAPSDTYDATQGYPQNLPVCTINVANDIINNASKTQYNAEVMQNNLNVTHSNNTCKQNNLEQNTADIFTQNITTNTKHDVNKTQNDNTFTVENVAKIQSKNSINDVNNTVTSEYVDESQSNVNNIYQSNANGTNFQRLYEIHPVFSMDNINKPNNSTDYAKSNQRERKRRTDYKKAINKLKRKSLSDYVALKFLNVDTPDFTGRTPCASLSMAQFAPISMSPCAPISMGPCAPTQSAVYTPGTKSNVLLNNENLMYITPDDISLSFTPTTGAKYSVPLNTKKKLQLPIETKLTQVIENATVESKLTKVMTSSTQASIFPVQVQNPTFITPINIIESFQLPKKSQLKPIMYRLPATMSYRCFICLQNISGNESTFEAHIAECKLRELKEMETVKTKNEVSLHQCKKCEFRGTFKNYKKHRLIHGGFQCDQCDYKGHTKKLLKNHKFTHQSVKRFKCSVCSYASHRREILKAHMLIHDDNRPFACNQCEYKARDKYALKNHQDSHRKREERKNDEQSKGLKYKCKLCEFSSNIKRPFDRHQAQHLRKLTFPCTQCEIILQTELNLQKHIKKWHSKTVSENKESSGKMNKL